MEHNISWLSAIRSSGAPLQLVSDNRGLGSHWLTASSCEGANRTGAVLSLPTRLAEGSQKKGFL